MASILFGLLASLSWGGGDFMGGLSSRRIGAILAVFTSELFGLVLLLMAVPILREPFPALPDLLIAFTSGLVGCLALLALYRALSTGKMSIAAPVSALLAAIVPIVIGAFIEGLPGWTKLLGFVFALGAVWLISNSEGDLRPHIQRLSDLRLPLLAGLGFGLYLVLINQVSSQIILWPMVSSRVGGCVVMLVVLLTRHEKSTFTWKAWPLIVLNAAGDIGGNTFYILAGQAGRMDVAAVISALYPGATVFLAWLVLKERISRWQLLGILSALVAIALMTV